MTVAEEPSKRYTLVDRSLTHQVVFLKERIGQQVYVTCNCLMNLPASRRRMGYSTDLDAARTLYDNPANHAKPFGPGDRAKW